MRIQALVLLIGVLLSSRALADDAGVTPTKATMTEPPRGPDVAGNRSSTAARAMPKPKDLLPHAIDPKWNAGYQARRCIDLNDCTAFCQDPLKLDNNDVPDAGPQDCEGASIDIAIDAHLNSEPSTPVGWQAKVLEGIAAFLVQRAKAEALASLVQHMSTVICDDETGRLMMPASCSLLRGVDPYANPVGWSALRAAFQSDLRELPKRAIEKLVTGDKAEPLLALLEVIEQLESSSPPLETIAGLQDRYEHIQTEADCKAQPYSCGLRTLGFLAETLADPVTKPDAQAQRKFAAIALRLFYERTKGYLPVTSELIGKVESFQRVITSLVQRFTEIEQRAKDAEKAVKNFLKEPKKALLAYDTYGRTAAAAVGMLGIAAFQNVASSSAKLDVDANQVSELVDHLTLALESVRNEDYPATLVEVLATMQMVGVDPPGWMRKYSGFVTTVAAAKTSEDLQNALESAAAPVGAWRAKRGRERRALTINGYVGMQGGLEWLTDDTSPSGSAMAYGLFAPIGLEHSWGLGDDSSLGLMLSVIDLGALVNFRESTKEMTMAGEVTVETTPELGFRQVFSPGVYALWGLGVGKGGIPLSLGAGFSITPQLRSVDVTGGKSTEANAVRGMVFLAFDISIFAL